MCGEGEDEEEGSMELLDRNAWISFLRDVNPCNSSIASLNTHQQPSKTNRRLPTDVQRLIYQYSPVSENPNHIFRQQGHKDTQRPFYENVGEMGISKPPTPGTRFMAF